MTLLDTLRFARECILQHSEDYTDDLAADLATVDAAIRHAERPDPTHTVSVSVRLDGPANLVLAVLAQVADTIRSGDSDEWYSHGAIEGRCQVTT